MKAILMSIQSQHLVNILNGKKTKELRLRIPKNYVGWIYFYCTKGKPYLYKGAYKPMHSLDTTDPLNYYWNLNNKLFNIDLQNGTIPCRFWFDDYDDIIYKENEYIWCNGKTLNVESIGSFYLSKLKLSYEQMLDYGKGKDLYALHIDNLEIFDVPMHLNMFKRWVKTTTYNNTDYIPHRDKALMPIKKAPQSWMYVEVKK